MISTYKIFTFRRRAASLALASLWLLCASSATAQVFSLEEPAFEILNKAAEFELRSYRPMVVAEVLVQGDVTAAGKEGSRLVKEYIFRQGANEPSGAGQKGDEKISMTVPVTMEKTSEKISMTVPVTMEASAGSGYRLHFVMPSKYTLQTLPKPSDPRVTLREIPAQRVAAVRFSKFSTEATIAAQTALLQNWMAQQGLKAAGKAQFARYDPPFVPPLLRRSEILIAVE
jgi:SOUL heme-binding protein